MNEHFKRIVKQYQGQLRIRREQGIHCVEVDASDPSPIGLQQLYLFMMIKAIFIQLRDTFLNYTSFTLYDQIFDFARLFPQHSFVQPSSLHLEEITKRIGCKYNDTMQPLDAQTLYSNHFMDIPKEQIFHQLQQYIQERDQNMQLITSLNHMYDLQLPLVIRTNFFSFELEFDLFDIPLRRKYNKIYPITDEAFMVSVLGHTPQVKQYFQQCEEDTMIMTVVVKAQDDPHLIKRFYQQLFHLPFAQLLRLQSDKFILKWYSQEDDTEHEKEIENKEMSELLNTLRIHRVIAYIWFKHPKVTIHELDTMLQQKYNLKVPYGDLIKQEQMRQQVSKISRFKLMAELQSIQQDQSLYGNDAILQLMSQYRGLQLLYHPQVRSWKVHAFSKEQLQTMLELAKYNEHRLLHDLIDIRQHPMFLKSFDTPQI